MNVACTKATDVHVRAEDHTQGCLQMQLVACTREGTVDSINKDCDEIMTDSTHWHLYTYTLKLLMNACIYTYICI